MHLGLCPTSVLGHSIHILLPHLSHVAQHGEDDKARQEAGQTVHRAGDQSISETEKGEVWVAGRRQLVKQYSSFKVFRLVRLEYWNLCEIVRLWFHLYGWMLTRIFLDTKALIILKRFKGFSISAGL